MKIIQKELDFIKDQVLCNIIDPMPENGLRGFLSSGSKFIRSSLAIFYLKSQNCEIKDDIYTILCAGELIHNASLLHDDVLDDAETRRGHLTISKKFSPKISILAGDYLLTVAIEKLIGLNNLEILKIFEDCTKQMIESEMKQYFLRKIIPSKEEYLQICQGKTAKLFASILESCSIISGIDFQKAKIFGELFGLCFQIKNDLNKESAIIDNQNEIYTARDILGIEKTTNLLDNYREEMRKLIKDFPVNTYKEGLEDLINLL